VRFRCRADKRTNVSSTYFQEELRVCAFFKMQQGAVKTAKRFSNGALAGAGDADERRKNREIASLHHIELQISNSIEQTRRR